jgi:hypothetical protein
MKFTLYSFLLSSYPNIKKQINFLFVTDLSARGIDIPYLENFIHFDFHGFAAPGKSTSGSSKFALNFSTASLGTTAFPLQNLHLLERPLTL